MLPEQRHFELATNPALFAIFMSMPGAESALSKTKEHPSLRLKTSQIADRVMGDESVKDMVRSEQTLASPTEAPA
jgi:hypothetical protein